MTLAIALATLGLSVYLFSVIPKGFFPQQDTGRLMGAIQADQDTSFQAMRDRLSRVRRHHQGRPGRRARDRVCRRQRRQHQLGSHVHRAQAAGRAQAQRRPGDRAAAQEVSHDPGRHALPSGDAGLADRRPLEPTRSTSTRLQGSDLQELNLWAPRLLRKCARCQILTDVNSDQQNSGLQARLVSIATRRRGSGSPRR